MYKLNTLEGRLRALADRHTLGIHTEFNGLQYVNMHTLKSHAWLLGRLDFECQLKRRQHVNAEAFDEACEAIGFEGIVRDELKAALFGTAPAEAEVTDKIEVRVGTIEGGLKIDSRVLQMAQPLTSPYTPYFPSEGGKPC